MALDWGNRSTSSPFLPGVGGADAVRDKATSTPGVGTGQGGSVAPGRSFVPGQLKGSAVAVNRPLSANEQALMRRGKLATGKGRPVASVQPLPTLVPVAPMPEPEALETAQALSSAKPGSLFASVAVDPNAPMMFIRC